MSRNSDNIGIPSTLSIELTNILNIFFEEFIFKYLSSKTIDRVVLNFGGLSGAKLRESERFRQELSNDPNSDEYSLSETGVDSAKNGPLKSSEVVR